MIDQDEVVELNTLVWQNSYSGIANGRVVYATESELVVDTLQHGNPKLEVWDRNSTFRSEAEAKMVRAADLIRKGQAMIAEAGQLMMPDTK